METNIHSLVMVSLRAICIGIGICSVVNPLTVSFYVCEIGSRMGLDLLNELGHIRNRKTQKYLSREAQSINFVVDLAHAGRLPWHVFHPLGALYSGYFAIKSTYNAINYLLFYKSRVENGEFDVK